jgi:hypothetical protein
MAWLCEIHHLKQLWMVLQWWESPFGLPRAFLNAGDHNLRVSLQYFGLQQNLWSSAISRRLCGGISRVRHQHFRDKMVPILLQNKIFISYENQTNHSHNDTFFTLIKIQITPPPRFA